MDNTEATHMVCLLRLLLHFLKRGFVHICFDFIFIIITGMHAPGYQISKHISIKDMYIHFTRRGGSLSRVESCKIFFLILFLI